MSLIRPSHNNHCAADFSAAVGARMILGQIVMAFWHDFHGVLRKRHWIIGAGFHRPAVLPVIYQQCPSTEENVARLQQLKNVSIYLSLQFLTFTKKG